MLEAVIADGGRSSVAALARLADIPVATAHRQVATLVAQGYLAPAPGGRHLAGPRLVGMLHQLDAKAAIANAAAPLLDRVAGELGTVVQLGTLENDMVTYRVKAGAASAGLFTKVGMQLEAYCSGMGKVLLAHLPAAERDAYLAAGPFPALTGRTIIDPVRLGEELAVVRDQGHAVDDSEIADGLYCVAVPIHAGSGPVVAAISASFSQPLTSNALETALAALHSVADEIKNAGNLAPAR